MQTNIENVLKELRANRDASTKEYETLKELVSSQGQMIKEIKEDLRGNEFRGIDGLIKTVKGHDKMLNPIGLVMQYPRVAIVVVFILFHLLVFFSFKGIDKLISFF
ncbi:MAG TPA: hypothetical protein VK890_13650 [Bacteroidia bacterium]|jgi:hypothetical protein|nr:hypothetical protein [Bacteroidia bacterium]